MEDDVAVAIGFVRKFDLKVANRISSLAARLGYALAVPLLVIPDDGWQDQLVAAVKTEKAEAIIVGTLKDLNGAVRGLEKIADVIDSSTGETYSRWPLKGMLFEPE